MRFKGLESIMRYGAEPALRISLSLNRVFRTVIDRGPEPVNQMGSN